MDPKRLKEKVTDIIITAIVVGLWFNYTDVQAMKVREPYINKEIDEVKKASKELAATAAELKTAQAVLMARLDAKGDIRR